MGSNTTNYTLYKPTIGGDNDTWGDEAPGVGLNGNMDIIDENLNRVDLLAQGAFPSDGTGTVTAPMAVEQVIDDVGYTLRYGLNSWEFSIHAASEAFRYYDNGVLVAQFDPVSAGTTPLTPETILTKAKADTLYMLPDGSVAMTGELQINVESTSNLGVKITRDTVGEADLHIDAAGRVRIDDDTSVVAIFDKQADLEPSADGSVITKRLGDIRYALVADANPIAAKLRAWGTVNGGTGAVKRGDGFTVVRDGVGKYTVTLDTPLSGVNYAPIVTCAGAGTNIVHATVQGDASKTAAGFTVNVFNNSNAAQDAYELYIQVTF